MRVVSLFCVYYGVYCTCECDLMFTISCCVTGLLSVIALVIYPTGWGTKRVRDLCGEYAEPYVIDSCTIGGYITTLI
jgi:hypothetical protein